MSSPISSRNSHQSREHYSFLFHPALSPSHTLEGISDRNQKLRTEHKHGRHRKSYNSDKNWAMEKGSGSSLKKMENESRTKEDLLRSKCKRQAENVYYVSSVSRTQCLVPTISITNRILKGIIPCGKRCTQLINMRHFMNVQCSADHNL